MYGNACRTLLIKALFEEKQVSSQTQNNGDQRRAIYMYSRLLTCHPAQMIKHINNDFPGMPFLQNSRHSSFCMKLKGGKRFVALYL